MKLISLNTWGGLAFEPLVKFIQENKDTDVFCFQEIYHNGGVLKRLGRIRADLLTDLKAALGNYQVFFYPAIKGYNLDGEHAEKANFDLQFGLAIFIKNSIRVKSVGQEEIYDDHTGTLNLDFSNLPVYFQYIVLEHSGKYYTICNFHGIPKPGNKLDTPERIAQSKKILDFLSTQNGAKIVAGDFNLLPDTESIHLIERQMNNLISQYNISITRSPLSPYYGTAGFQKFADYAFVSAEVVVKSFKVPDIAISDHLPMILEFS